MAKFKIVGNCANCGAPDAIHHFDTMQCPKGGEEAPIGRRQLWMSSTYEEVLPPTQEARVRDAALELLEALLAIKGASVDGFKGWAEGYADAIKKAEAAIAKATGREGQPNG